MPYKTIWEKKGICWQHSGVVTSQEIYDANNEFYSDPRSDLVKYQIVDCANIDGFVLEDTAMKKMAAFDAAASKAIHGVKVALIGKEAHVTDVFEDYIHSSSKFTTDWDAKIFDNMEDARNWLNISAHVDGFEHKDDA